MQAKSQNQASCDHHDGLRTPCFWSGKGPHPSPQHFWSVRLGGQHQCTSALELRCFASLFQRSALLPGQEQPTILIHGLPACNDQWEMAAIAAGLAENHLTILWIVM